MKLVVIESPLAGDFERNRRYALWCAYDATLRGEAPYLSHLFFPQFLDDQDSAARALGIRMGLAWASCGEERVFCIDLGWTDGMKDAKEVNTLPYHVRHLPMSTMDKFWAGAYPTPTKGFEAR